MESIFDIGLFNGLDTAYYLELGFRVVAVEANPVLFERATILFQKEIELGRLKLINGAISDTDGQITLHISGDDLGSSSVQSTKVERIQPIGSYRVQAVRFPTLIDTYGIPHFLKVDIEGSDRHCILPLKAAIRPRFLSLEIGDDFEELFTHLCSIGYDRFKIIDQTNFRNISRLPLLSDRIRLRLTRYLGYGNPRAFRRNGRFFSLGSSGPVPWQSDGNWVKRKQIELLWQTQIQSGRSRSWHDLLATCSEV